MLSDEQPSSGDDSPHTANRKWCIGEKAELATRRETLKRKRLAYNLEQGKREKLAESKKQEQEQRDMVMAQELAAKEAKEAQRADDSIMKCDVDIRKDLYGNIVLSGGAA